MFGIYDNLISDYVPGLQKYDMCMTEQVPGPQGVKIVGRHIASAPYSAMSVLHLELIKIIDWREVQGAFKSISFLVLVYKLKAGCIKQ